MATEIKWSYGQVVVIEKDASPDPVWSCGIVILYYEATIFIPQIIIF